MLHLVFENEYVYEYEHEILGNQIPGGVATTKKSLARKPMGFSILAD
jgi:hypothetical protein